MAFLDFITPDTLRGWKDRVEQFAALGKLYITNWASGQPGEQLYQAFTQTMEVSGIMNAGAVRGMFLEFATDPGDVDPYAPENVNLAPAPGALSRLGKNHYYTIRRLETQATTTVTFTNSSGNTYYIAPGEMTLARAGHPETTYRNVADPSVYTDVGGTKRLSAGASIDLDVAAETPGSGSSAAAGEISVLVSTLIGVTVTNAAAAIGQDREDADHYRDRCRQEATATSPNGAADKYRYYATTLFGGTPLLRADGNPVGVTKVNVSGSSTTGIVNVYFGDDDGPADGADVTAANENIQLRVVAPGDCITYTGAASNAVPVVVTWYVKYISPYRGVTVTGPEVKAAIVAALQLRFKECPIGGFAPGEDGYGGLYLTDIAARVETAHPAIIIATLSEPEFSIGLTPDGQAVLTTPTGVEEKA